MFMENINKSYFGVKVLNNVGISVKRGEIHALLGENGAGKSTLMNILGGVISRDSGTVVFDGNELNHITPKIAQQVGVAFVHQELNLFNDLKVFENIFLNKEIQNKYKKLNKKKMIEECLKLFNNMNIKINPTDYISDIDPSSKQLVEIAKALHSKAKLIIMDEPTTALNSKEIEVLFEIMRNLKLEGTSFIYISHKIPEIFEICNKYTVLRNGLLVSSGDISETNPEDVTKLMVGGNLKNKHYYMKRNENEIVLNADNISGNGFSNVSFKVKKGEVVAFTGLQGSGCSELIESIFGYKPILSGTITLNGKVITKTSIHKSMKNKIALLPRNRKENSIIPTMNLIDNMMISRYCLTNKKQHINEKKEISKYNEMKNKISIKANSYNDLIVSLSGGNQQKVIIGRWLSTDADVYIFDNPTQGIDVGSKDEIYKLMGSLIECGKSVIINTLEIPEIEKISNRCFVLYHGKIVKELSRQDINEETVMLYATNAIKTM